MLFVYRKTGQTVCKFAVPKFLWTRPKKRQTVAGSGGRLSSGSTSSFSTYNIFLDHVAIGLIFYVISWYVRNARCVDHLIEDPRWSGSDLWRVNLL